MKTTAGQKSGLNIIHSGDDGLRVATIGMSSPDFELYSHPRGHCTARAQDDLLGGTKEQTSTLDN